MTVQAGPVNGSRVAVVASGALAALGFVWGSFAVLLTDLSRSLQLAPGGLGLALTAGMVASLPVMTVAGRVAERAGCGVLLGGSGMALALGFVGLANVDDYPALLLVLATLSAASGAFDIAVNTAAVAYERVTGRQRMAVIQAMFSTGGAVGALSAGALLAAGVPFTVVYLTDVVPLTAVVLAAARTRFPICGGSLQHDRESRTWRNRPLLVVAVVAALGFLAEAAMEQWSGVYLRATLGVPALAGASAVAVYHGSMAAGRLVCACVTNRLGEVRTLRAAGLLTTAGLLVAVTASAPLLVVTGFFVVGLALAAVLPIALTLAGAIGTTSAGAVSSVVTTIGYAGFLFGPILIGAVADATGLRAALGIVAIVGVLITFLASPPAPGSRPTPRGGRHRLPSPAAERSGYRNAAAASTPTPAAVEEPEKDVSTAHARQRGPGERANVEMKDWKILIELRRIRSSPNRPPRS
jgi:MFS family permease